MKKTLARLVAAATIAVTLAATATDASAYWRGRCRWRYHCLSAARICSVPKLRPAGLRTRLLLDIPTGLRWFGPHRRIHGPARAGLPGLC